MKKCFFTIQQNSGGVSPSDVDSAVTARVPVYLSKDNRYFQDKYQGIPLEGYTKIVEKMLKHPNIEVRLNTEFKNAEKDDFKRIFYTGAIDEFFDYKFGELPYRSVNFKFETKTCEFYQRNSVVNYPCNYDFTRIHEYKHYLMINRIKRLLQKNIQKVLSLVKTKDITLFLPRIILRFIVNILKKQKHSKMFTSLEDWEITNITIWIRQF